MTVSRSAVAGAVPVDGLGMLVHQAALQQQWWHGVLPDVDVMTAAAERELAGGAVPHPHLQAIRRGDVDRSLARITGDDHRARRGGGCAVAYPPYRVSANQPCKSRSSAKLRGLSTVFGSWRRLAATSAACTSTASAAGEEPMRISRTGRSSVGR